MGPRSVRAHRGRAVAIVSLALIIGRLVLPAAATSATAPSPTPTPPPGDATTQRVGPTYTGAQTGTMAPPLVKKWSLNRDSISGTPLMAGGRLFVVTTSSMVSRLEAFDLATGQPSWPAVAFGSSGHYTYDAGTVFVIAPTNGNPSLVAVDAVTGLQKWSVTNPNFYAGGWLTAADGTLYASAANGGLYAINEADGSQLWLGAADGEVPAVSSTTVYLASGCTQVSALDRKTGSVMWHHPGPCSGGGGGAPAVAGSLVFAPNSLNGNSDILDAATGKLLGTFASSSTPAIADGVAYTIDQRNNLLRAVNIATRQVLWTYNDGTSLNGASSIVENGYVYLASGTGGPTTLTAINLRDGSRVWNDQPTGSAINPLGASINAGDNALALTTESDLFVYGVPSVSVGSLTPYYGPPSGGQTVTIAGSGFSGTSSVNFGSNPSPSFAVIDDRTIGAVVPPGTGTVDVVVAGLLGSSTPRQADRYTYEQTPVVASISPTNGPASGGSSVRITGRGLTGASQVLFGASSAHSFRFVSDTEIVASAPPASIGAVDVRAMNDQGTSPVSSGDRFTYGTEPYMPDKATSFQVGASHEGQQTGLLVPPLKQAWSRSDMAGQMLSYPVIADGRVFVIGGANLYALDAATGADLWGPFDIGALHASLAYDAGRLFVMAPAGSITAIDAETGAVVWATDQLAASGGGIFAPLVASNGIVVVDSGMFALNESDGSVKWFADETIGTNLGAPAVRSDGVWETNSSYAYAFDLQTGAVRWRIRCGGGGATPALTVNSLYVRGCGTSNAENSNVILDATTGAQQGTFPGGGSPQPYGPAVAFSGQIGLFSATKADGFHHDIVAVDTSTGTQLWTFAGDGQLSTPPVTEDGVVYAGSSGGNVYGLDAATGGVVWMANTGAPIPMSTEGQFYQHTTVGLGLGGGLLVVPTQGGLVAYSALSTITGTTIPSAPGTGSTHLTLTGTGLSQASHVDFGSTEASFTPVSDTQIAVTTPPLPSGTVDIRVVTPHGITAAIDLDRFTATTSGVVGPGSGGGSSTTTSTTTTSSTSTSTSTSVPGAGTGGGSGGFGGGTGPPAGQAPAPPTPSSSTTLVGPSGSGSAAATPPPSSPSPSSSASTQPAGYWIVARDGGVFAFGDHQFVGSGGASRLRAPVVGAAATPSRSGYWLVAADGGIFSFGDASFVGSTGGTTLNSRIVGMASTPSGRGYWLVAADGGVFSFGDAKFLGSTGGVVLNQPVVGMATTPDGNGYWLVARDGGVFAFGNAGFYGSTGAVHLNAPIVQMAATPTGRGYWFVASDGGVYSFGDAAFYGSTGSVRLNDKIVAMAPAGPNGYWLVAADGGIFAFGSARFCGSAGGLRLGEPIVTVAA